MERTDVHHSSCEIPVRSCRSTLAVFPKCCVYRCTSYQLINLNQQLAIEVDAQLPLGEASEPDAEAGPFPALLLAATRAELEALQQRERELMAAKSPVGNTQGLNQGDGSTLESVLHI